MKLGIDLQSLSWCGSPVLFCPHRGRAWNHPVSRVMRMEAGGQQQCTGLLSDYTLYLSTCSCIHRPPLATVISVLAAQICESRKENPHDEPSILVLLFLHLVSTSWIYRYFVRDNTKLGNKRNCPRRLPERAPLCALVSSVCHARTDEEEVEVWEAGMDDGTQTIWRGAVMRCTVWGKFGVWGGGGGRVFALDISVPTNNLAA